MATTNIMTAKQADFIKRLNDRCKKVLGWSHDVDLYTLIIAKQERASTVQASRVINELQGLMGHSYNMNDVYDYEDLLKELQTL